MFLAVSLVAAKRLLGWKRTGVFFGITWLTAFVSEFSSTRIGIPFGPYFYTGSTVGEELYVFDIPFMDSLSFTFLLFSSFCLALLFMLPGKVSHTPHLISRDWEIACSWPLIILTSLFFMFVDIVIDPVALRGDRWFLGQIYGYPHSGIYFGIPLANFLGWFVVGMISMSAYRLFEARKKWTIPSPPPLKTGDILLGCGLYYGVLVFNLAVTFWIEEWLLGMVGCFIYLPITILALFRVPVLCSRS